MFNNNDNTYSVKIPSTAPYEVVEWFDAMNNCNLLNEALIDLVLIEIKSGKYQQHIECKNEISAIEPPNTALETGFISSLYNWQDSSAAIFNEPGIEKRERKKMLSI